MSAAPASVSVDLDNQWAYMKTQGVPGWETFPTYLSCVVPRILETLQNENLRITFFIVGKDAEIAANKDSLRSIAEAGHEIANHSYMHEPWLHLYDAAELKNDFDRAEAAIEAATGHPPRGFRGPGFSTSPTVRAMLQERGYLYDSSLFPTVLGPLARAYFFLTSKLPPEEKARRSGLYGRIADGFSSLAPYEIAPGLTELPVTTMPLLRTPIHLSYLLFLARFSMPLARLYWGCAVTLCRLTGTAPSLLLHPTDFLDVTDAPAMGFFPAMSVPAETKIGLVRHALQTLKAHWHVLPMIDCCHAAEQKVFQAQPAAAAAQFAEPTL